MPRASDRSPLEMPSATASTTSGAHHGRPSGAIRVTDAIAASSPSTTMIGTSAVSSGATVGLSSGAERRSAAIRAAVPSCAFTRLPT